MAAASAVPLGLFDQIAECGGVFYSSAADGGSRHPRGPGKSDAGGDQHRNQN
jgi:hypothetical protein